MRILFITDNFPPEVNAPATRTYEHCREWVKSGAEVTVITCTPNFPQGCVYDGYKNRLFQREKISGINVLRVWSYITRNEGFIRRSLDYFSFAVGSFFAGLAAKADIIVATSPQFFTTLSACFLSKIKKKPWVFELRDLWPESIKTVGVIADSRLIRILEKLELALYRDSSMVVALTPAFRRNLISRGIDPGKIRIVTNGANLDLFGPREKDSELVKRHYLEGKFVVGYIGTHGMAHSLEFIVQCLGKISDPAIRFLFIGDGALKENIVRTANLMKLENVTFLDPVAKELVPRYLSVVDTALVPLLKSDTFKTVIPSKIFEAAAMRKPILLGVDGQAREIIEKYNAGICFEPENEADFLQKMEKMKKDRQFYRMCQEGCSRLARYFDRRKLALDMYFFMENMLMDTDAASAGYHRERRLKK